MIKYTELPPGLHKLFPTLIYKTKIDEDTRQTLLDACLQHANIALPLNPQDDVPFAEKIPLLKDLTNTLFTEFFEVAYGLEFKEYSYLLKSWVTGAMRDMKEIEAHNHPGSSFTAIIYLLVDEGDNVSINPKDEKITGGELLLQDPRGNANRGYPLSLQEEFSTIATMPNEGDVLIIPGYLYHSVFSALSNHRISIPLDIYIKDTERMYD